MYILLCFTLLEGAVVRIAGGGLKPPKFSKKTTFWCIPSWAPRWNLLSPSISALGHVWANSLWDGYCGATGLFVFLSSLGIFWCLGNTFGFISQLLSCLEEFCLWYFCPWCSFVTFPGNRNWREKRNWWISSVLLEQDFGLFYLCSGTWVFSLRFVGLWRRLGHSSWVVLWFWPLVFVFFNVTWNYPELWEPN